MFILVHFEIYYLIILILIKYKNTKKKGFDVGRPINWSNNFRDDFQTPENTNLFSFKN